MNDLLDYAEYLFKKTGKPVDLQKITDKDIKKWEEALREDEKQPPVSRTNN